MSLVQKLITNILPTAWSRAIRQESQNWLLRCPHCTAVHSIWDAGGIRYKATSTNKKVRARCPTCSRTSWMSLEWRETP